MKNVLFLLSFTNLLAFEDMLADITKIEVDEKVEALDVKNLIKPFFDEEFYKITYKDQLDKTKLSPIDHFLSVDWKGKWENLTDPNPWFKSVLYRDKLWPCEINPLVDWLQQPKLLKGDEEPVAVFAKKDESYRAWMAIEAFLRDTKHPFKPVLFLNKEEFKDGLPLMYKPQLNRGLEVVDYSGYCISFYESSLIKTPKLYGYDSSQYSFREKEVTKGMFMKVYPVTEIKISGIVPGDFHSLYTWSGSGSVNPKVISFARYESEPAAYRQDILYIRAIFDGFDLITTTLRDELIEKKMKFIPGNAAYWGGKHDTLLSKNKNFSISYLHQLPAQLRVRVDSLDVFRRDCWNRMSEISIEKLFYVSLRRGTFINKPEFAKYLLPSDSKHYLFSSQFSIAIENFSEKNYMTEKLYDCLLTLTIPIYVGCPNVGDFFDLRGIFIAKDADEIINICNSLKEDTYEKMLPYAIENKKRTEEIFGLKAKYYKEFYETKILPPKETIGKDPVIDKIRALCCEKIMLTNKELEDLKNYIDNKEKNEIMQK